MTTPIWLEVALNGPWSRELQPDIPITVEEIVADGIACAEAGAAIVHLHAYDERTGRQRDDATLYARIIDGIRAKSDVIVYPTLPLAGSPDAPEPMPAGKRFEAVEELGRRGLLEWAVVDPGSVHFARYAAIRQDDVGFVYQNPGDHVRHGLELARRYRFHPSYAIYEPGFLRFGAALHRQIEGCPRPVYRFMFSNGFAWGLPPKPYALDAYLRLLEDEAPGAPWMVAGLDVDIAPLIGPATLRGGHIRVGLEDAPFGEGRSNRQQVLDARALIERTGARLASPAEVRLALSELTGDG
ncbi:MAG: 3-keto-5-aminohexanoate cleavage protein [Geminicoccaceae bacterium]|nr:3-keto-5-aminohexanoate cleavage protein [Geminicoccaceae bacterium]